MLRSAKSFQGYTLHATDGDIGHVNDFLFDDLSWTIRYLVVDTGTWLPARRVLISPVALRESDWSTHRLGVAMTKHQIETAPGIESDAPVTRRAELEYFDHFGWPYYWGGPGLWGYWASPAELAAAAPVVLDDLDRESHGDPHLQSVSDVHGYTLQPTRGNADESIGHVADAIVDDDCWQIRYLAIDSGHWWAGKHVVVSPAWIDRVSWEQRRMFIALTREQVRSAPEWSPHDPVNRAFEERLYDYYGRPAYWPTEAEAKRRP